MKIRFWTKSRIIHTYFLLDDIIIKVELMHFKYQTREEILTLLMFECVITGNICLNC